MDDVVAKELDRYRSGEIDDIGLENRFKDDPGALEELAMAFMNGDGVEQSDCECSLMLERAIAAGSTEAAWKILGMPMRQGETVSAESDSLRGWIAFLLTYTKDMGDDEAQARREEAERHASADPLVAATLICAHCAEDAKDIMRWEGYAGDVLRPQALYEAGRLLIRFGQRGARHSDGLDRIRESADLGHPEAMLELGKVLSSGCGPEHWRAVEYLKGAMGAGIAEAGRWLCLYEPISGSPATGALFSPEPWKGLEGTRWPYAIPCDEGSLPELWLLVEMCGFVPGSLIGDLLDHGPGDEVYEDDTFLLLMDGRVADHDKVRMRTMPSLWFKPTGLELRWGEWHLGITSIRSNRDLGIVQFRQILRMCLASAEGGDREFILGPRLAPPYAEAPWPEPLDIGVVKALVQAARLRDFSHWIPVGFHRIGPVFELSVGHGCTVSAEADPDPCRRRTVFSIRCSCDGVVLEAECDAAEVRSDTIDLRCHGCTVRFLLPEGFDPKRYVERQIRRHGQGVHHLEIMGRAMDTDLQCRDGSDRSDDTPGTWEMRDERTVRILDEATSTQNMSLLSMLYDEKHPIPVRGSWIDVSGLERFEEWPERCSDLGVSVFGTIGGVAGYCISDVLTSDLDDVIVLSEHSELRFRGTGPYERSRREEEYLMSNGVPFWKSEPGRLGHQAAVTRPIEEKDRGRWLPSSRLVAA